MTEHQWNYLSLFVIVAVLVSSFFRPFRQLYMWLIAYFMLNSGSPIARKIAHWLGYTWDEFGCVVRIKPGEQLDQNRVAYFSAVADRKAAEKAAEQAAQQRADKIKKAITGNPY